VEQLKRRWGVNVAERRRALGMSQRQLAIACGVTQQSISAIERGLSFPTDGLKVRLVEVLGQRGADLFPLEPQPV
jgi:transcriptional regulator with XRE-family HTH domain